MIYCRLRAWEALLCFSVLYTNLVSQSSNKQTPANVYYINIIANSNQTENYLHTLARTIEPPTQQPTPPCATVSSEVYDLLLLEILHRMYIRVIALGNRTASSRSGLCDFGCVVWCPWVGVPNFRELGVFLKC